MKDSININIELQGESSFFIQMVQSQTGMSYSEILTKMMSLYKEVYLSEDELAWVKGSVIKKKLSTDSLKRK